MIIVPVVFGFASILETFFSDNLYMRILIHYVYLFSKVSNMVTCYNAYYM